MQNGCYYVDQLVVQCWNKHWLDFYRTEKNAASTKENLKNSFTQEGKKGFSKFYVTNVGGRCTCHDLLQTGQRDVVLSQQKMGQFRFLWGRKQTKNVFETL